jgi:heme/copper-type cytochrome/quinol oxidase subunit 3
MLLFIISEVMFFFGFFWAFFHASLAPSHMIGAVWPPATIATISPWQLPLVNTLCLLLSGVTLTIAHRQLTSLPYYNQTVSLQWPLVRRLILWLQVTLFLGVFFLFCQGVEYYLSPFTFQDTVFGGTFYILTGLHGLHVLVGTIFLLVCLWRASRLHFTLWKQVGFKSAVWYWHFVDVVWIFLFIVIYIWGGLSS